MKERTSMLREPSPDSGGRVFPGEGAGAAGEPADNGARAYRVFLSYSHVDTTWAHWLMRRLEGYRVPARFHGRAAPIGIVGPRIAPVFRDRDELPTTSDLGETIHAALRQSATLVVICSPAAGRSRWVQEEILAFKRLGGGARVFAFIVAGEPKAEGTNEDCFSPALRAELGADGQLSTTPAEHVAADARPEGDGPDDAFVRLVAGLLGVGFDELRQREQHRRHRRLLWITAGSVAGMAVTLGLAAIAWRARNDALVARNDAQRRQEHGEELIAGMLNDMKAGLQKADKLDALDEAGARLIAYFQSLDPRDLTDNTLSQQAKALTQIGQMRVAQLRYADASAAFAAAYTRAAALVSRHPGDGDRLFDRAQAECWIGIMHRRRGDLVPAGEWLTRYRDTGVALTALNPANLTWQQEAVAGHHNLAVLDLDRGNLAAARAGFEGELVVMEQMAAASPQDHDLQFSEANVISYLGTAAERNGDYAEAVARFGDQIGRVAALPKAELRTARSRQRLADAIALQCSVMAISGQRPAALTQRKQVREIFDELAARDPANREWQTASLNAHVKEAVLLHAEGDVTGATRLVRECLPLIQTLARGEKSDRAIAGLLAMAWRLEAQLRDAAGEAGAAETAAQAMTIGKSLVEQNRANETNLGDYASACVLAGVIAQRAGDADGARRHWQTALDAVGTRGRDTRHWRLLDPAARALALLGRIDECRANVELLDRFGYQPLDPWPEPIRALLSVRNQKPE
jgi:eukaryotic-like serine/threonine-protein kinase